MGTMPRVAALAAAWLVAAVVAVTISWQGVSVVADQVTNRRPARLSASEIERLLAEVESSTTTIATETSADVSATSTAPPSTALDSETRTYNLLGGTASLRFGPGGVEVVFANPAPGFRVEVEAEHGNGVKVEFEADTHESRVDGWWDGGPMDRTREEPKD
jgi:hypothetical protein